MINFNVIANEYTKEHHTNWPKIPNYPYRLSIIGGSRSGKIKYFQNYLQRALINYKYVRILPLDRVSIVN